MSAARAALKADVPLPLSGPVSVAAPEPPFATGSVPVTPVVRGISGMSPATRERSPTAPVIPFGEASTLFAACPVAQSSAMSPVVVIGEFVMLKTDGAVRPTLSTVPPPPPGGDWHEPSPRR